MFWNFEVQTQIDHFLHLRLTIDLSKKAIFFTFVIVSFVERINILVLADFCVEVLICDCGVFFVCFWLFKDLIQTEELLTIFLLCCSLCKMANFQTDVISRILSVFVSRFSHRITVILNGVKF